MRRVVWSVCLLAVLAGCGSPMAGNKLPPGPGLQAQALGADGGLTDKRAAREEQPAEVLATLTVLGEEYVALAASEKVIKVSPQTKKDRWTREQLLAMPGGMNRMLEQLPQTKSLSGTLTLKKALSLSELEAFLSGYGLQVESFQLRRFEKTKEGSYERLTYMASPRNGVLVSDELRELEEAPHYVGVISLIGSADKDDWLRLSRDTHVFSADLSSARLKEELGKNPRIRELLDQGGRLDIQVPNLYWELEDAGIVQYEDSSLMSR
ncbi:hypothetical protein MJA45_03060 [Paenibacillus aurantius]|uniref:Lipoprotein n=1 Tax=Paenibacillus aurantius TaxID=2918900 RepID=A0AA96RFI8_9BACL|nr:hypothetical protein [Paenibacillus aurantius]WNQ12057.1 hypothetical protein MJA45_03060 [Paenibacillus aurantius]